MRRVIFALAAVATFGGTLAWGQTHAVKKPDEVTRAVAVYEWTGEEGKPSASRIVPVSLFIDSHFQDAAIYMARPIPFALDTGTVYEVRKSGVDSGTLELLYERHLTPGDSAEIDDGWLGYGEFKVKPKETLVAKKQSGPLPKLVVSGKANSEDSGGPKMVSRTDPPSTTSTKPTGQTEKTASSSTADADPDSPTLKRRAGSEDATPPAKPDDADPSAERSQASGSSTASSQTASNQTASNQTASSRGRASSDDTDDAAERPTLKRRTPAEIKAKQKQKDSARVVAGNDLNDDADRPTLHRGSKALSQEEEVPPLRGLPKEMKQLVAVSDAKDRPEHDFVRSWESADERVEIMGKMQAFARQQLAGYRSGLPSPEAPPPANDASTSKGSTATTRVAKRKIAAVAVPISPQPLSDEALKGFTLSYGGAATFIYTATSSGGNGVARYVTVVAQDVPVTGLKIALANVTDSTHLDRTPWMRFVDVVDADASNRASVLMELRAQHTRQFALYRVIGAQADQVFLSGSTE